MKDPGQPHPRHGQPFAYRNKAQYAVRGSEAAPKSASTASTPMIHHRRRLRGAGLLHVELNARVRGWMREHDIAA